MNMTPTAYNLLNQPEREMKILAGTKYGLEVFWVLRGDRVVGKFLSESAARTFILSRSLNGGK